MRGVVREKIGPNLETKTSGIGNGDGAYAELWSGGEILSRVIEEFRDMNGDLLVVLVARLISR